MVKSSYTGQIKSTYHIHDGTDIDKREGSFQERGDIIAWETTHGIGKDGSIGLIWEDEDGAQVIRITQLLQELCDFGQEELIGRKSDKNIGDDDDDNDDGEDNC